LRVSKKQSVIRCALKNINPEGANNAASREQQNAIHTLHALMLIEKIGVFEAKNRRPEWIVE
jgi:hypothetical protein